MPGLLPVDSVEILTLVDNYSDGLLPETPWVSRPRMVVDGTITTESVLAEPGLSLLVTTRRDGEARSVILDAGYGPVALPHNIRHLGLDLSGVETVVISHGHEDHTGAIRPLLEMLPRPIQVAAHPDAFLPGRISAKPGRPRIHFPHTLRREEVLELGADITECSSPLPLAGSTLLATGPVPRITDFEQGFAGYRIVRDGVEMVDRIEDDQALVVNLRGLGLVVITGCAHAGVVNTLLHARAVTGEKRVHAVIGGFHLPSPGTPDEAVERTVAEIARLGPVVVSPMHCSGPLAACLFRRAMPEAFVQNCVGTTIRLPRPE